MKNFDTRAYSITDFLEWDNIGLLEVSPDFQRRGVWSEKAKSYLIDTIIRGKPIPKILITQQLRGTRTVRVIVDGQQRVRAILGFIAGDFKISKAHNGEYAGLTFSKLPSSVQNAFLSYELGVDLLFDMPYQDVLDIFARLNSYTVKLNSQELMNATYLGFFKTAVYEMGYKHVDYFLSAGVLTRTSVNRMSEAELCADLFAALIGGIQTNKNVEKYYKQYEDDEGDINHTKEKFESVMQYIGELYSPEELKLTNWSRIHLFYTLFTVIAHFLYGISNLPKDLRVKIVKKNMGGIRSILDDISTRYDVAAEDLNNLKIRKDLREFIDKSRRGTTDTAARIYRAEYLCREIKESL